VSADGLPELYVYYKVAEAQAKAALRAFDQAVDGLDSVRLLRREQAETGQETWMEIHCGSNAAHNESRLAAALIPFISGARHIEQFLPLRGGVGSVPVQG
jgi:hypothetical protein